MTIGEAVKVLELHNQWRKGAGVPQESPVRIGMAIDLILCEFKTMCKKSSVSPICNECGDGSGWWGDEAMTYNCSKCNPEAK
jgi:hypothetical protein